MEFITPVRQKIMIIQSNTTETVFTAKLFKEHYASDPDRSDYFGKIYKNRQKDLIAHNHFYPVMIQSDPIMITSNLKSLIHPVVVYDRTYQHFDPLVPIQVEFELDSITYQICINEIINDTLNSLLAKNVKTAEGSTGQSPKDKCCLIQ